MSDKLSIGRIQTLMNSWFGRISSAMFDQAIFSGGTFLINILLGRWLGIEAASAFAVAYAWLMLALNIYDAVLIEPMAVFGSGKYSKQFRQYLGWVYYAHLIITLLIAIIMGIAAYLSYLYDSYLVFLAMAGAALASPFFMLRWLCRQPFYVLSSPHLSAIGGIIFLIITVALMAALNFMGSFNPFNAMLVMGFAALVSGAVVSFLWLKPDFRLKNSELSKSDVLRSHFDYGKWAAPSRILYWLPGNIFYILLPIAVGSAAPAVLYNVGNLFQPLFMLTSAIGSVLLPNFVRAYERDGLTALHQRVKAALFLGVGAIAAASLFMTIFGQWIIHILYDGKYDESASFAFIATMAIFPVLNVIQQILDIALRAMGQVRLTFFSKLIWGIGTVTIGVGMMFAYGLIGTNLGQNVTAAIALALTLWYYYRYIMKPRTTASLQESEK